jgi:hypothetical protein
MALLTKRAVKEGGFEKQRKRQQQGGTGGQLPAPQQRCWNWLLGLLAFARLRKSR